MLKEISANAFKKATGQVLRTINVLRQKYIKLDVAQSSLENNGIPLDEFMDAVNYLMLEGYIQIRSIYTHKEADIADVSYKDCEARLSAKGIQLLAGEIDDGVVEV